MDRFLPPAAPPAAAHPSAAGAGDASQLFACLRAAPAAVTADPNPPHVIVAKDFSPRLERHGASSVVLDIGGLGRLLGDAFAIGAELERAVSRQGASLRIAIALTQTAARLLAMGSPGITVAPVDAAAAVAGLPLDTLRVCVGEDTADANAAVMAATARRLDTFRRWGLSTLGDIAALPAADLSARMGQDGLALQRLACGVDRTPLVPDPGVVRFVQSMELEWPIDSLEPLSFVFARLLDPLAAALERADRAAAALRLDLRLVDRRTHARVLPLPAAIRDAKVLRTLLLLDLESHPPPAGIDIVSIEIDPAPARIVQYSLLERAVPSPETLATLTARLSALVGENRLGSPILLDTWRPDGFDMRRFDLRQPDSRAVRERSWGGGSSARRTDHDAAFERPAEPRDPTSRVIVRRFRPPVAVRVAVERGRPARVAIDRRGMPGGDVVRAAGPWRTSGAWWAGASMAWDRDEWDVALADGSMCRLYHDRIADRWFLDGILD